MLTVILYFLFAYGLCNILVYADGPFYIFTKYRNFMHKLPSNIGEGTECMICTPFQIGFLLSIINIFIDIIPFTPSNVLTQDNTFWFFKLIFDGCITSGTIWLIHTVQEYFERGNNNEENE